jgi:hypothetical protein
VPLRIKAIYWLSCSKYLQQPIGTLFIRTIGVASCKSKKDDLQGLEEEANGSGGGGNEEEESLSDLDK